MWLQGQQEEKSCYRLLQDGARRVCALLNGARGEEERVAVVLALLEINPHQRSTSEEEQSPTHSLV